MTNPTTPTSAPSEQALSTLRQLRNSPLLANHHAGLDAAIAALSQPAASQEAPEPLFVLHCGEIDSSGEHGEWETEANGQARVDEFCRRHPGQKVKLYPHQPSATGGDAVQAVEALDQWIIAGCPGGPWRGLEHVGLLKQHFALKPSPASKASAQALKEADQNLREKLHPRSMLAAPSAARLAAQQGDILERCAQWCESQDKGDWWGHTAADMVRAYAAATPQPEQQVDGKGGAA